MSALVCERCGAADGVEGSEELDMTLCGHCWEAWGDERAPAADAVLARLVPLPERGERK